MSNIALASEEHKHTFKVRYKLVGSAIVFQPVCKCARCDVEAHIRCDGYRVIVTFTGNGEPASYTAVLMEEA